MTRDQEFDNEKMNHLIDSRMNIDIFPTQSSKSILLLPQTYDFFKYQLMFIF